MRPAVSVPASGRHSRHHVVASVTVEIIPANGATVVENGKTNPQGAANFREYSLLMLGKFNSGSATRFTLNIK